MVLVMSLGMALPVGAGDAERGRVLFDLCVACHGDGTEDSQGIGPHLSGVYGRHAAALDGYAYSDALRQAGAAGLIWDGAALDAFIAQPAAVVPGTRMSFDGLADPDARAHLVAYLRHLGDVPVDGLRLTLPAEILALEGDIEWGAYLAGECTTCHQADGSDEGIPSITHWPTRDFVLAMHAYKRKLRANPVMQTVAGALSDDEIAALAAYFEQIE